MPSKKKELQAVSHEPSVNQVRRALKAALYSSDPWQRAEGAAKLESWDLPITPAALPMAARRVAIETEIIPLTLAKV
jgi:hypothetical protein